MAAVPFWLPGSIPGLFCPQSSLPPKPRSVLFDFLRKPYLIAEPVSPVINECGRLVNMIHFLCKSVTVRCLHGPLVGCPSAVQRWSCQEAPLSTAWAKEVEVCGKEAFLPCTKVLVTMQSGSPGRLQHRGPSPSPPVLCPFLPPPSPTHAHSYSLGSGKRRGLLWELLVQFGEVFLYAVIVQIHVATEIKCLEGEAAGCENSP